MYSFGEQRSEIEDFYPRLGDVGCPLVIQGKLTTWRNVNFAGTCKDYVLFQSCWSSVFHLNENIVSAGFFGVDVFFVISGFVITSLLLRELYASNSIDVLNFYSRRAKRLLPNASLVLFVTLVAGMFILPNSEAVNLSRDVIAAAVYLANFHFADNKVDYFSSTQALSAVVHYWSLSIEEQFYIAWPLIMLAVATYFKRPMHRRAIAVILTFIIICSFSLCLLAVRTNQPLAFFHTGTRVWELAAGASLAIYAPQLGNFFCTHS